MAAGVPAALASAMNGPSANKPFTYLPGGLDFSEIRSPRMAKRMQQQQLSMPRNSLTTEDIEKKVQPQWSSTVPRGASVPRLPVSHDLPTRPENQRQKSISDLLSMPMGDPILPPPGPVKTSDRPVIGRDPYNPYAKQSNYVNPDQSYMPGYTNGFNDLGNSHSNIDTVNCVGRSSDPSNLSKHPINQSQICPAPVPQGSLASTFSEVPIAPAPPAPAMPLKINAALPPHPPKPPLGRAPPAPPPPPPAGYLTEDFLDQPLASKQTMRGGKIGQIHAQLEQERQAKKQEKLLREAEEKQREELQKLKDLEEKRQLEIQRQIEIQEQQERERRQRQLELQEQQERDFRQRQQELQELEYRKRQQELQEQQEREVRQRQRDFEEKQEQELRQRQRELEEQQERELRWRQQELEAKQEQEQRLRLQELQELQELEDLQRRKFQKEELERQLMENLELEKRQKELEEELARLKKQQWVEEEEEMTAKKLPKIQSNGHQDDLNHDVPWYDSPCHMEPMEIYEEVPRDGIDVTQSAMAFNFNNSNSLRGDSKNLMGRLPPAPQVGFKSRRSHQSPSPHSMVRKGLPPLPTNATRSRDRPPPSPPVSPVLQQRQVPLHQVPLEAAFQKYPSEHQDVKIQDQDFDLKEPIRNSYSQEQDLSPFNKKYQQEPPETVSQYGSISLDKPSSQDRGIKASIPTLDAFGPQEDLFDDVFKGSFFQPFLQGPFGIANFGNHMEPIISPLYHNRQAPQQYHQPVVSERQNDGGRIIPIFVETRKNPVPKSNSFDSVDKVVEEKPTTLRREIKIKVAKSPPQPTEVVSVPVAPPLPVLNQRPQANQIAGVSRTTQIENIVDELREKNVPNSRTSLAKQQSLQESEEPPIDIEQKIMTYRRASEPPDARKAVLGEFARHAGGRPSGIAPRRKPCQSPSMWLLGKMYIKNNENEEFL